MSSGELSQEIINRIEEAYMAIDTDEVGKVLTVGDGIAKAFGLHKIQAGELVEFSCGVKGLALNLEFDQVGIVVMGSDREIQEGDLVRRTGEIMSIPVGKGLLGRVVDALGQPIDGKGPIKSDKEALVEVKAPGILQRKGVHEPLKTGLKVIDSLIPIGRGQRELIIGDGRLELKIKGKDCLKT